MTTPFRRSILYARHACCDQVLSGRWIGSIRPHHSMVASPRRSLGRDISRGRFPFSGEEATSHYGEKTLAGRSVFHRSLGSNTETLKKHLVVVQPPLSAAPWLTKRAMRLPCSRRIRDSTLSLNAGWHQLRYSVCTTRLRDGRASPSR